MIYLISLIIIGVIISIYMLFFGPLYLDAQWYIFGSYFIIVLIYSFGIATHLIPFV